MTAVITSSSTITLDDVINESRTHDIGKVDLDISKQSVSFGYETDPSSGEPLFYIRTDNPNETEYKDKKLYLTDFSYTQVWKYLMRFPISGVSKGTGRGFLIPPSLIKDIAQHRLSEISALSDARTEIRARLKKDTTYVQTSGTSGNVFFRGLVPRGRPVISTTTLLEAIRVTSGFLSYELPKLPSFPDYVFFADVLVGDSMTAAQQTINPAVFVANSEVGAIKCTIAPTIYFQDHDTAILIPKADTFQLYRESQLEAATLTLHLDKVLESNVLKESYIKKLINTAEGTPTKIPFDAADDLRKKYNLPIKTRDQIHRIFKEKSFAGSLSQSQLGLAISIAKAAAHTNEDNKLRLMKLAGSVLTQ